MARIHRKVTKPEIGSTAVAAWSGFVESKTDTFHLAEVIWTEVYIGSWIRPSKERNLSVATIDRH